MRARLVLCGFNLATGNDLFEVRSRGRRLYVVEFISFDDFDFGGRLMLEA